MEGDREDLCGPKGRHQAERPAWRGGSVASQVTLGGRQDAWDLDFGRPRGAGAGAVGGVTGARPPRRGGVHPRGPRGDADGAAAWSDGGARTYSAHDEHHREPDGQRRGLHAAGQAVARRTDDSTVGGERAGGGGAALPGGCGATATYATWSAPWTRWPRPTVRLLTWRRIDDLGAETGSPPLAKFNNERDNPSGQQRVVLRQIRAGHVDHRDCRNRRTHLSLDAGVLAGDVGIEPGAKRRLDQPLAGHGRQVQQAHVLDVGPLAVRPTERVIRRPGTSATGTAPPGSDTARRRPASGPGSR